MTTGRADPRTVRYWNEALVIDELDRATSPMRIAALAERTGLSPASLGHVLRGLEDKGWVVSGHDVQRRRGRPAQVFRLANPEGCVLGLDLGPRVARIVRMDLRGQVVARVDTRLRDVVNDEARIAELRRMYEVIVPPGSGPVWLAGIADAGDFRAPGRDGGAPGPMEYLRSAHPHSIVDVSDAHALVHAAREIGAANGFDDVLHVHLGWRPRLGMIVGGRVHQGAHQLAGHLRPQSVFQGLESPEWPTWVLEDTDDGSPQLIESAVAGDEAALARAREYLLAVAPLVGLAAAVVDPQRCVVSGAFAPLGDMATSILKVAIEYQTGRPADVVDSGLDQYGAAIGAALIARRRVMSTLVSPVTGAAPFDVETLRELGPTQSPISHTY